MGGGGYEAKGKNGLELHLGFRKLYGCGCDVLRKEKKFVLIFRVRGRGRVVLMADRAFSKGVVEKRD